MVNMRRAATLTLGTILTFMVAKRVLQHREDTNFIFDAAIVDGMTDEDGFIELEFTTYS